MSVDPSGAFYACKNLILDKNYYLGTIEVDIWQLWHNAKVL